MSIHSRLERQINNKLKEIQSFKDEILEYEMRIREAEAFIAGIRETLKVIPAEEKALNAGAQIRPGTDIAKVRDVLREHGSPLRIEEILNKMGKELTKGNRQAVSGQLSQNYRQGRVFTRPHPNTFGLLEWGISSTTEDSDSSQPDDDSSIPPGFGEMPK